MGGPTTTTNQTQNTNQNQQMSGANVGSSTTTPNMPSWLQNFYQSIPGQYGKLTSQLSGMAGKPLYGQQQQANFQQQLGQQYGQANQNLQSQLARSGALNSNRAAQMGTGLALGQAGQMGNYLSQTPLLNAQNQQSVLGQLGNTIGNAQNFRPPIGQTTDNSQLMNSLMNGASQMNMNETQQQSGGLMQSLLGGLLGAGMSALTGGIGGVLGGSGFGAGASSALAPNLNTAPSGGGGAPSGFMNYANANPFASSYPPPTQGYQSNPNLLNQLGIGMGFPQ